MCLDFEVRSLDLKKGKFEEIGETPYQKPLSKTPSKNPSKCKAFSLRSKIMPFKENLISLRATGFGLPKTAGCNNGAGGSTEETLKPQTHLTEPQGKIKSLTARGS